MEKYGEKTPKYMKMILMEESEEEFITFFKEILKKRKISKEEVMFYCKNCLNETGNHHIPAVRALCRTWLSPREYFIPKNIEKYFSRGDKLLEFVLEFYPHGEDDIKKYFPIAIEAGVSNNIIEKYFLKIYECDPNEKINGKPIIFNVIGIGNLELFKLMISEYGGKVSLKYKGENFLHVAIRNKDIVFAHYLVCELGFVVDNKAIKIYPTFHEVATPILTNELYYSKERKKDILDKYIREPENFKKVLTKKEESENNMPKVKYIYSKEKHHETEREYSERITNFVGQRTDFDVPKKSEKNTFERTEIKDFDVEYIEDEYGKFEEVYEFIPKNIGENNDRPKEL